MVHKLVLGEKWIHWTPTQQTPLPTNIKSILLDEEGLTITCYTQSDDIHLTCLFSGTIYSYRFTDESSFLKSLEILTHNYDRNFLLNTTLFEVVDSNYLNWYKEESFNVWDTSKFKHYVIYTENDVLEVLSPYEPEFKSVKVE